jgi:hypothetical protein
VYFVQRVDFGQLEELFKIGASQKQTMSPASNQLSPGSGANGPKKNTLLDQKRLQNIGMAVHWIIVAYLSFCSYHQTKIGNAAERNHVRRAQV